MTDKLSEVARAMWRGLLDADKVNVEVANASFDLMDDKQQELLRIQAKAAIEAMREPTDAMVKRGREKQFSSLLDTADSDDEVARDTWQAMVDAALEGKE